MKVYTDHQFTSSNTASNIPMTESDAKKFQILFERETGEKISLEEAWGCAESLIDMIRLVYKPITKKDYVRCTKNPDAI